MKKIITLFLLLILSIAPIVAKEIKGRVVTSKVAVLADVSVYLKKNPQVRVFSHDNGEFVLSLEGVEYNEKDRIIFSHIGYETKEYQINELGGDACHEVVLAETSMMLDDVVVVHKLSRRDRKRMKISIIEEFKKRLEKDFVFEDRTYRVASDVEVARGEKKIFYNKLIGEYVEMIGAKENKKDSVVLVQSDMENYIDNDIILGFEKMSDRFVDNNVVSKKRRENKRMLDSSFYEKILNDSTILENVLSIHEGLWHIDRNIKKRVLELDDDPKQWEIITENEQVILKYKYKQGFLGIFKNKGVLSFVINPNDYSLERVYEKFSTEINIPFGYRLPPDALMFINIVNLGNKDMKKYRVRHLYFDASNSIIYKTIDEKKYVDEKSFDFDISITDTKKRTLKAKTKALVKVLAIEDN